MAETLTKTAVIGSPINHSLSPSIHNYWINKNKIKTDVYQKIKIDALELNKKIHNLINDNFIGLNVTIPLKELAFDICEELSETSKQLKAVNTLTFKKGKVIGNNTDPKGFINSINDRLSKFNLKLKNTLYCKHSTESLIASLKLRIIKNSDLILLYGSTSIVDKNDVLPKSLEKVNGKVISFGAPTDPGNLIMYGKLKNIKVIGVPGCAKSSLRNGFDLMLEKACFDLKINKKIIAEMSYGGLYKNFIKNNHET